MNMNKNTNWMCIIAAIVAIFILNLILSGCNKPHCAYQSDSSCEIFTDGDESYVTFMARGQHLCCWYGTMGCYKQDRVRFTEDQLDSLMVDWYRDIVENHRECLLEEENCGPSRKYGRVTN